VVRVAENSTGEGAFGTLKPAQVAQLNGNGGGGVGPGIGNGNGNGAGPGPFDVSSAIPNNFWGYVMLVVGMR